MGNKHVSVNGIVEQGEDGKWRFYVELIGTEDGRTTKYQRLDDPRSWETQEECERIGMGEIDGMMREAGVHPKRSESPQ